MRDRRKMAVTRSTVLHHHRAQQQRSSVTFDHHIMLCHSEYCCLVLVFIMHLACHQSPKKIPCSYTVVQLPGNKCVCFCFQFWSLWGKYICGSRSSRPIPTVSGSIMIKGQNTQSAADCDVTGGWPLTKQVDTQHQETAPYCWTHTGDTLVNY